MPATSIRDLVIHDDDLVVGTHGRSFWILDDITPLRQLDATVADAEAHLFRPQVAYRVRWNLNTDTPLPPEEPAGRNPPDGAIINYVLKATASAPVTLEILDARHKLVRRYSSADKPEPVAEKELDIPTYWIRPTPILPATAGSHRFVWDLHYPPPAGVERSYPISAIYRDTPSEPRGPLVPAGEYTVRLTVDGKSYTQPLAVKMDPRLKTPPEGLAQQFELSMQAYEGMNEAHDMLQHIRSLRTQLKERQAKAGQGPLAEALARLDQEVAALEGGGGVGRRMRRGGGRAAMSLTRVQGEFGALLDTLQGADATPTAPAVTGVAQVRQALNGLRARWTELQSKDVRALDEQLRQAKLSPLAP
jgi:hypothetical protein